MKFNGACSNCPDEMDCFNNGACVHLFIRATLDVVDDYAPLADFPTELTDAANLNLPVFIPRNENPVTQD